MSRTAICANCLATFPARYVAGLQIGGEYGSQRDPSTHNIDACEDCAKALMLGDLATIHSRYRNQRTIAVGENGEVIDG